MKKRFFFLTILSCNLFAINALSKSDNSSFSIQFSQQEIDPEIKAKIDLMGETDLLKIKEQYTFKVRQENNPKDKVVLDYINLRIKTVRGSL